MKTSSQKLKGIFKRYKRFLYILLSAAIFIGVLVFVLFYKHQSENFTLLTVDEEMMMMEEEAVQDTTKNNLLIMNSGIKDLLTSTQVGKISIVGDFFTGMQKGVTKSNPFVKMFLGSDKDQGATFDSKIIVQASTKDEDDKEGNDKKVEDNKNTTPSEFVNE